MKSKLLNMRFLKLSLSVLALSFAIITSASNNADTTYWTKGGNFNLNFSQVSFVNWSAGGLNAIAGVTKFQYFANYKKGGTQWDNLIDLGYGLSKVQGISIKKNEDIIDLQSKLGIRASEKFFYSGLLNLKSQFAPGWADVENTQKISNLFSPAYIVLSFGMDYKPTNKWSVMLSPLTGKMTIVTDPDLDGMFGVESGKNVRMEMGAMLKAALNTEIAKNVGLLSEIGLFTNYLDRPENIDVDWKLGINMKINSFMSASINTHLIYDADIIDQVDNVAKIQFKELFGVGFNFKF
jgi:hypothetical protein